MSHVQQRTMYQQRVLEMNESYIIHDHAVCRELCMKWWEKKTTKAGIGNDTSFYTEYYGSNSELLVQSIREYHHIKGSHGRDEHYLEELLR